MRRGEEGCKECSQVRNKLIGAFPAHLLPLLAHTIVEGFCLNCFTRFRTHLL
jgi:hypothetical protein